MTAENNGLKTENAELRKERDFYCNQVIENGGRAQRAIDALNDENDRLRERIHELEMEGSDHFYRTAYAEDANRTLEAENAKLVDVLHEVEDEAVLAFNSLRQDCETITDSSQHFFEKWWHAECEVDRLKSDNARLRELVRDVWHLFTEHGAVNPCDLPVVDAVRDRMRELGVDV